jgi:hypothetical protein
VRIELKNPCASGQGMRLGRVPSGDCPRSGSRLKSSSFGIPINQINIRFRHGFSLIEQVARLYVNFDMASTANHQIFMETDLCPIQ